LQIKDALKYLEKNPDLQKTATHYMMVGRAADNSGEAAERDQIIEDGTG
jgi:ATP-dependent helicase HrpA